MRLLILDLLFLLREGLPCLWYCPVLSSKGAHTYCEARGVLFFHLPRTCYLRYVLKRHHIERSSGILFHVTLIIDTLLIGTRNHGISNSRVKQSWVGTTTGRLSLVDCTSKSIHTSSPVLKPSGRAHSAGESGIELLFSPILPRSDPRYRVWLAVGSSHWCV